MTNQTDSLIDIIADLQVNGWDYGTHPRDKAMKVIEAVRQYDSINAEKCKEIASCGRSGKSDYPNRRTEHMMLIIKSKNSHGYLPAHDVDLLMFRHCCEGMIEVKDISFWLPVFAAHNIQIMIQDETL